MEIVLPNLAEAHCERISACGRVESPDTALAEILSARRYVIAPYTKGGTKHFVRIILGDPPKNHFHIEVARASWFRNGLPKKTAKLGEIATLVSPVFGEKITVGYDCDFSLPFSDLPENGPIKVLSGSTSAAGTSVELTAGKLKVSGSYISSIQWERVEDEGDRVRISLDWTKKIEIKADYLCDAFELAERFFKVLVLETPAK